MAYSVQSAVSDGTLVLLAVSIPYFRRDEITVFFDEVEVLVDTAWSWVGTSAHSIKFDPAVDAGVVVRVERNTNLLKPRHVYTEGAPFTARTLDENFQQTLRVAQEMQDGVNITDIYQDVDMHGHSFINVGSMLIAAEQPFNLHRHTAEISAVVPTGFNAISGGPVVINPGVTITVDTGSTWSIV